ncbi:MAG TPA: glutathione S-transferase family protein [Stellaceae bacterium]|nr:glutathione S-transferase family protein [Stellaceae bacterium]
MAITLYDLAGAEDDRRFSPFCWRVRMALAHKGLAVDARPWRFTEKDAIAFSGQSKVPVIVDGGKTVFDSWAIAEHLDAAYPEKPLLMATPRERAVTKFVMAWTDTVLHPAIFRIVALDIHDHLHEKDKAYFRKTREERFGTTLEAFVAGRDEKLAALRQCLTPLRTLLSGQPFLCGEAPAYADYVVFGAFQWARAISPARLLAEDDPVAVWRRRLLDAFGGMAGAARGYPA